LFVLLAIFTKVVITADRAFEPAANDWTNSTAITSDVLMHNESSGLIIFGNDFKFENTIQNFEYAKCLVELCINKSNLE